MNRMRIVLVVAVAILLALLASFGAYRYLSDKRQAAEEARLQTVGIVVAGVDIPVGTTINANQVLLTSWPKDLYPKDAVFAVKDAVGRMARRDFLRGEPIVESKLVPTDKSAGLLSLIVPPGSRAFSVRVNEVVGVGGFIVPDARVDVLVTTMTKPEGGERISKTVLENIQVLAAGQTVEMKENKPITVNTVTLSVTPEEAEKLALASNDGVIQLVLRNFQDHDNVVTAGVTKARLLASYRGVEEYSPPPARRTGVARRTARKPSPAAPPPRRVLAVEIIKGNKRSEELFEETRKKQTPPQEAKSE